MTQPMAPLSGLRIIEVSSFVAAPLCGLTLSQLGAEVIRIDPIGGASDYHRWPVTEQGESIYWTGLNKGKKSLAVNMRSDEGRALVQQLVTAPGVGNGILVTNAGGRGWMSHDTLSALRNDVITLEILGRRDGSPGVDYTVNAALGFPMMTGPADYAGVVNHVLPAWDMACGLYAGLAVTAAVRKRDSTGAGSQIMLPLEDVALATAGTLGYLTEVQINGQSREYGGNAVYGTYGIDFVTSDNERFMLVALTTRHFRDLTAVTGTVVAVDAVESALGADFSTEADRYRHREVLTALFSRWFCEHSGSEVTAALEKTSVLFERYRSFANVVESGELENNPMFSPLEQPRIGTYLAAANPASFDGAHFATGPASEVGEDSTSVLADILGTTADAASELIERGIIGVSSK
ncbi:CoA transferase [Rhodococcus sp. IEGM 1379]|uniref:CoA transferase n=1 Tax=Rhodococcus sp. IEGM 1379 TaxID=3047086 RepID=UPI0024B74EF3|nr:CoA transferase [Rhodococcus sp. IEGM 1379]MDI9914116.1 CoA transferase [Rhodococcus sp. IEGM 1379]